MVQKLKIEPRVEIELKISKGDQEVIIPFGIRDFKFEDKMEEATIVEIKAVVFPKDWELWGRALSLLPKI